MSLSKYENLKAIFNLGRLVTEDSDNSYLHLAYTYKLNNYKLITNGELIVNGKDLDIPSYMLQFLNFHGESIMIANIVNEKVISITLRSLDHNKEFMKIGTSKSMLYGLGNLNERFKYGDPLILVEGHLDRDVVYNLINKNVVALTTNKISKTQLQILNHLTNNFILLLDNDEAGMAGTKDSFYKLKGMKVHSYTSVLQSSNIKDCGDLLKLSKNNPSEFNWTLSLIKSKVYLETA